ncbi:MAG: hypothetical protein KKA84_15945 [Bacteroidetes bacterium]|nr:hypothetical protein [Bacteroidota bacterium]
MEKKRVFRQDYVSLDKEYEFKGGEEAIIIEEKIPNVKIKVDKKLYQMPYRDFIVISHKVE